MPACSRPLACPPAAAPNPAPDRPESHLEAPNPSPLSPPPPPAWPAARDLPTRRPGLFDYILVCCQSPQGGLRDKPGRGRDYYHTCYGLSGYAVCAAEPASLGGAAVPPHWPAAIGIINPVYNVSASKVNQAMEYFYRA